MYSKVEYKRDVLCYPLSILMKCDCTQKNWRCRKPEYSKAKSSIDLSDQMASYASALRKTVKW
nr:unnamed protein product [Callosobruchus chinensis]